MTELTRRTMLTAIASIATTAAIAEPDSNRSKEKLVGTWVLASIYRELEDGSRFYAMGENPKGIMIFDSHGRFSHQIMRAEGSKLAERGVTEGVSEENRAVAAGVSSYFGTYLVEEAGQSIVLHVEASLFANQIGAKQRRFIKISENTMEYWTPKIQSANGSFIRRLVWRRAQ